VCELVTSKNQIKRDKSSARSSWLLHPSQTTILHPSTTSLVPHFSWLLHLSIGYQKAFQVSTESKQMQTSKPQTAFDKELRPVSTTIISAG